MSGILCTLWSFRGEKLEYALIHDGRYEEFTILFSHLDEGLLPFLESLEKQFTIEAFFVNQHEITGFASTRLLLTTLNIYAWEHDIPIDSIDEKMRTTQSEMIQQLTERVRAYPHFTSQLVPHYRAPADITASQSMNTFTISE